jgi:hypothetical protein
MRTKAQINRIPRALVVAIGAILAGCHTASGSPTGAATIPFVPGQGSADQLSDLEHGAAERAIAALAGELHVHRDKILVDTVQAVNWPDSSIGCPKPDVAYLQVVTPGYKVILRAEGQIYTVHEAGDLAFLCRNSAKPGTTTRDYKLAFGRQLAAARDDLAQRLQVPPKEIRTVSAEPETWDDASLGCPQPGVRYEKAVADGWVLTLSYRDRNYTYHADSSRAIPCPAITAK